MISEKIFNKKRWKKYKDILSLVRNWFPLFRSIILYKHARNKLEKINNEFSGYENQVVGTTCFKATELMRKYINQLPRTYDHLFVILRNTLRILMLNFKLQIPFWKDLFHPITVTFLGLIQNITSLFKIWLKHRYLSLENKLIRVQDFIRFLPRVQELAQLQHTDGRVSSSEESIKTQTG